MIPDNPFVESDKAKAVGKPAPAPDAVAMVPTADLVLGSTAKTGPYRLEVQLDQKGAGVTSVASSRYEAEFVTEKPNQPKHRPLQILKPDPLAPPSLAMTLVMPRDKAVDPDEAEAAGIKAADGGELPLDGVVWEVVRDDQGRVKRPVTRKPPAVPRRGSPPRRPSTAVDGQIGRLPHQGRIPRPDPDEDLSPLRRATTGSRSP